MAFRDLLSAELVVAEWNEEHGEVWGWEEARRVFRREVGMVSSSSPSSTSPVLMARVASSPESAAPLFSSLLVVTSRLRFA